MEGTFNFDADGMATVVDAPQWSRDALDSIQSRLTALERVVVDKTVSDAAAFARLETTIEEVRAENARLADLFQTTTAQKPRNRLKAIVVGIGAMVAFLATVPAAFDGIDEIMERAPLAIQWMADHLIAGEEVNIQDYPLMPPTP